jgi:hypothetical protein
MCDNYMDQGRCEGGRWCFHVLACCIYCHAASTGMSASTGIQYISRVHGNGF